MMYVCAITFAGQTNVDRYTGNLVIPKIAKPGFHCKTMLENDCLPKPNRKLLIITNTTQENKT